MKHDQVPKELPFASQAVPFGEFLETGKIPQEYVASAYISQQFVERLVHYVLSVPAGSFTMPELAALLEQLDPGHQFGQDPAAEPRQGWRGWAVGGRSVEPVVLHHSD